MPIDYVITYVDGSDKEWQAEYERVSGKKINAEKSERYRSWDNLKYNLRAVEQNLPFIRNVYLVVSGPSQVPSWVNTETVHVVYHKDIIPEKFLPVFCSTAIEMFLGFIPGLSENFIYANDDTFVMKKCDEKDFFINGKPVLNYAVARTKYNFGSQYEIQLSNSFELAQKASGKSAKGKKCVPPHSVNPMSVSSYKHTWAKVGPLIEKRITKFREDENCNQYLFSFYDRLTDNFARSGSISGNYLNFDGRSLSSVCKEIEKCNKKLLCVNDYGVSNFSIFKENINDTFDKLFPNMSKYEKLQDTTRQDKPLEVHLYTLCYNEMALMPFAVDYWKTVADKVFVLDNGSNDGSIEYLQSIPGVEVIHFGDGSGFNDKVNMRVKNHVWKASRGKADFVIVTDFDEFMYAKDLRAELQGMKDRGETICKPRGYNIYSKTFPEYQEGKLCHEICGKAIADKMFCKVAIFNPNEIREIRYEPGAHNCRPLGNVKWYSGDKIFLLHHKNIGLDYVLKRNKTYTKRMSADNRKMGWGVQYSVTEQKVTENFNNTYNKCEDVQDVIG